MKKTRDKKTDDERAELDWLIMRKGEHEFRGHVLERLDHLERVVMGLQSGLEDEPGFHRQVLERLDRLVDATRPSIVLPEFPPNRKIREGD